MTCVNCGGELVGRRTRYCSDDCAEDGPPTERRFYLPSDTISKRYAISPRDYEAILEFQDGRCAITGVRPRTKRLSLDHDHGSGLIRGLLSDRANQILGEARDDPAFFVNAAVYLLDPPAVAAVGALYAPDSATRRAPKRGYVR